MVELEPGSQIDRYVVEKLLGRGGMASVWRVRREDLGVRYALKILEVSGRTVADRLLEEGRIQATLRHPNIVSVVDVLSIGAAPALVLEYVEGPSLEQLLGAHRLGVEQIDDVARGILRGVRAAHRAGFVHRDLKPGNILMARADDGFVPKIADFGLAKLVRGDVSPSKTRTGLMMGTPAYMAPEQLRNARDVDERADIYSLGVVLYEICTGTAPYDASDFVELVDRMRARDYPTVAELAPALPARMGEAVARAMEVDLDKRSPTVQAVYDAWTGRAERSSGPWDRDLLASFDDSIEGDSGAVSSPGRNSVERPRQASVARPRVTLTSDPGRASPSVAREPAPPGKRPRGLRALVALTGAAGTAAIASAGVGVLVVVGIVAWSVLSTEGAPSGEPAPTVLVPGEADPEPVDVPEPVDEPETDLVAEPQPAPGVARAPVGAPATPAPAPAVPDEPLAPETRPTREGVGHVRTRGDASVELRDPQGARFKPGRKLPAGAWEYRARFPDGVVVAGTFTLEPGSTRTIVCDATFGPACEVE